MITNKKSNAFASLTFFAIFIMVSAGELYSHPHINERPDYIEISNEWVRPTVSGKNMTAAFFDIKNNSDKKIILKSAEVPNYKAELHRTIIKKNGVAIMRKVDEFVINPGDTVHLKPGGRHIMLLGVRHPIGPGDTINILLNFNDGTSFLVYAPVKRH